MYISVYISVYIAAILSKHPVVTTRVTTTEHRSRNLGCARACAEV